MKPPQCVGYVEHVSLNMFYLLRSGCSVAQLLLKYYTYKSTGGKTISRKRYNIHMYVCIYGLYETSKDICISMHLCMYVCMNDGVIYTEIKSLYYSDYTCGFLSHSIHVCMYGVTARILIYVLSGFATLILKADQPCAPYCHFRLPISTLKSM